LQKALEYGLIEAAFAQLQKLLIIHQKSSFWTLISLEVKSIATFAFQCNLEDSSGFLLTYLTAETVLWFADAFVTNCPQRNTNFFEIVVHVCQICSGENFRPARFFGRVFPLLEEIIENAVVLSPDHPLFRAFSSKFYGSVYKAFIYSAYIVCPDFECEQYFGFFVAELFRSKEKWRVEASLRGLTEIVRRFSALISLDSIEIALSIVLSHFPQMRNLIEGFTPTIFDGFAVVCYCKDCMRFPGARENRGLL
jgi:hypothetical protein